MSADAEHLFDPGPRQEPARRRPPVYGADRAVKGADWERNDRVRQLYQAHVLGYDVPRGHVPTAEELKRTRKARGEFNVRMLRVTERLGLPQFGRQAPTASSRTSSRTAQERAEDAARTPMRRYFGGAVMSDWIVTNVYATLCDLAGLPMPLNTAEQLTLHDYLRLSHELARRRKAQLAQPVPRG